jgi:hypothetical protein
MTAAAWLTVTSITLTPNIVYAAGKLNVPNGPLPKLWRAI